jgi:hypothetical protein
MHAVQRQVQLKKPVVQKRKPKNSPASTLLQNMPAQKTTAQTPVVKVAAIIAGMAPVNARYPVPVRS